MSKAVDALLHVLPYGIVEVGIPCFLKLLCYLCGGLWVDCCLVTGKGLSVDARLVCVLLSLRIGCIMQALGKVCHQVGLVVNALNGLLVHDFKNLLLRHAVVLSKLRDDLSCYITTAPCLVEHHVIALAAWHYILWAQTFGVHVHFSGYCLYLCLRWLHVVHGGELSIVGKHIIIGTSVLYLLTNSECLVLVLERMHLYQLAVLAYLAYLVGTHVYLHRSRTTRL